MLIVQKYGGTSVGSVARIHAVAAQVRALTAQGTQVAVVVSAMGDATDRLIELAREVSPEPDAREMDALLATGEMVSTALLAMALCKSGCRARSWNALQLPIETTGPAGRARIERVGCEGLKADLAAGVVPVVTSIPSFRAIAGNDSARWTPEDPADFARVLLQTCAADLDAQKAAAKARFARELSWDAIGARTVAEYGALRQS